VILSDNDFTYFVQHATEVVARVRLEYETKTVAPGALFYEEFLPPETLLYSVDIAGRSRNRDAPLEPAGVLQTLDASMPKVLQIGGNETTGKGLCAVRLSGQSTGGAR